jgi:undecaprenyl-phosphate 4-deoxy-4-formamido-L-arabinose transferase
MELSVVIPIYHTAKNSITYLPEIISRLRQKFTEFEILFIIDNEDIYPEVRGVYALKDIYKEVKIYKLNRNYGQHFATLCGYQLALGKYMLSVDEDMTAYIPVVCSNDDYKNYAIYFWHYNKNPMYSSVVRKLCSILFKSTIHWIINFKKNSTFRMIRNDLRNRILTDKHIFWNIDVMIFNHTENIGGNTLEVSGLNDDNSSYNYKTLISIAFEIAYEHNTIFMNFLLAFIPALIMHLLYNNFMLTTGFYFATMFSITAIFMAIKKATPDTRSKIAMALHEKVDSKLFNAVPD